MTPRRCPASTHILISASNTHTSATETCVVEYTQRMGRLTDSPEMCQQICTTAFDFRRSPYSGISERATPFQQPAPHDADRYDHLTIRGRTQLLLPRPLREQLRLQVAPSRRSVWPHPPFESAIFVRRPRTDLWCVASGKNRERLPEHDPGK